MQIWAGKVLNFSLQSSKLFACKTQRDDNFLDLLKLIQDKLNTEEELTTSK